MYITILCNLSKMYKRIVRHNNEAYIWWSEMLLKNFKNIPLLKNILYACKCYLMDLTFFATCFSS